MVCRSKPLSLQKTIRDKEMNTDRIQRINEVIDQFFQSNPSVNKVPAKSLMPDFIRAGVFQKDYTREGLPIRKVLRELDKEGNLDAIPSVLAEAKTKNTNWFFVRIGAPLEPEEHQNTSPEKTTHLSAIGFSAPVRIAELRTNSSRIPEFPGVYIVLRRKKDAPVFLPVGSGGHHQGNNPNVPVPELESNWIPGEEIVYIGMTRSSLRHRINTYLRFGQGQPVGHWGGRFIWQLEDHEDLEFCWKTMPSGDPDQVESQLIDLFKQQHGGKRPFANLAK